MKTVLLLLYLLISGKSYQEQLPNITAPQQIIWVNTYDVVFVKDEYILEMDLITKKIKEIGKRVPNDFVGIDTDGDIALCTIEHFLITSKDQYSTIFKVNGKELRFFPTIRPISFKGDNITAVTALDFLEQHYYEITISTGEIKEIDKPEEIKNKDLYIEEDMFGNIYLNCNIRSLFLKAIRNVMHL
jgi:hypothetical protein